MFYETETYYKIAFETTTGSRFIQYIPTKKINPNEDIITQLELQLFIRYGVKCFIHDYEILP